MSDILLRSIAKEVGVRLMVVDTTDLVREGVRRHKSTPTASVALGRALSAAALAGTLLKVKQRIALKFDGDGPLGKLITESDAYGRVRGYVETPKVEVERDDFGRINVPAALGVGELHVSKDVGRDALIQGVVSLQSSQIGDDFAFYLNQSEQIPSTVQIDVRLDDEGAIVASGGVLLQNFGDADPSSVQRISERLEELPPMIDMLVNGQTPADIAAEIFGADEYDVLEERQLEFNCGCSLERSEKAIAMLGKDEIEDLIKEGSAAVTCHFCHEEYTFSAEDLRFILRSQQA